MSHTYRQGTARGGHSTDTTDRDRLGFQTRIREPSMVDISIIGAGEVGRALATHLLRGELIGPPERLQLVGHGREASERKLLAERCDLLDAFDETAPSIQVAATLEEVAGDIIVLAAGATISGSGADRRELAAANRPLLEAFGAALARAGTG